MMAPQQPAQRAGIWPADRAAYTLMEMLISSVLIAALMSVIWGMLSMYNGYLTAGRQQSVERQLIRSVFSSLESDVRQVAVADTNPRVQLLTESLDAATESTAGDFMGDASAGLESGAGSGGEMTEKSLDTLEAQQFEVLRPSPNLRLVGLRGSETALRLNFLMKQSQQSQNQLDAMPEEITQPEAQPGDEGNLEAAAVPEFRTVLWYFRSLQTLSANTETASDLMTMVASVAEPGLYRIETSAQRYLLSQQLNSDDTAAVTDMVQTDLSVNPLELLLTIPEGTLSESSMPGTSEPIRVDAIPEVVRCRIRYYTGSYWQNDWNSEAQAALPLAIRIELTFVPATELSEIRQLLGQETTETTLSDAPAEAAATGAETPSSNATGTPSIRFKKLERIIVLQPIQHPFPMLEDTGSSETPGDSTGFSAEGAL